MAGGFSPQLLDEIRSRVDLVDLIGQFVNLRRAGENWKSLCPFHAEKTPSFMVNPKKGIFHCFGCGAGGDAFGFLMRQDRLSFPEAVRALARMGGVAVPEERQPEPDGQRETLYRVLSLATQFYAEALWNRPDGARARQYLDARGIDPEVARRFGLGYAPEGWDQLLTFMRGSGMREELLAQAGLVVPRQPGAGFYDRFRGRLIFPIRDSLGRSVAFGGRGLGSEEPKYLNSPETPLFVKGQTLYALDLARTAIRDRNRVLIVEGYVDCLMAHQHGFTEAVAALGTAFTGSQFALAGRNCDEVVIFFDADVAGQKASSRAEELIDSIMEIRQLGWAVARTTSFEKAAQTTVKVALIPAGHDPDSFLRTHGATAFQELIAHARSLFEFVMDKIFAEEDTNTARGLARARARVSLLLARSLNGDEASSLARKAALKLGVDSTQLWIEAQRLQGALRAKSPEARVEGSPATGTPWPPPPASERDLLALLLNVTEARVELLPLLEAADLAHPGLGTLLRALKARPEVSPEALMPELAGESERGLLAAFLVEDRAWADPARFIQEYRKRYEIRHRLRRLREVTQAIAQAQAAGDPSLAGLEAELRELERQAREVRELAGGRPAPTANR